MGLGMALGAPGRSGTQAGGGAPSLHTAWMMEPPTLDAEQACELTLGSQLWPCSLSTRSEESHDGI